MIFYDSGHRFEAEGIHLKRVRDFHLAAQLPKQIRHHIRRPAGLENSRKRSRAFEKSFHILPEIGHSPALQFLSVLVQHRHHRDLLVMVHTDKIQLRTSLLDFGQTSNLSPHYPSGRCVSQSCYLIDAQFVAELEFPFNDRTDISTIRYLSPSEIIKSLEPRYYPDIDPKTSIPEFLSGLKK